MSEDFIIYETHNGLVPVTDKKQIKLLGLLSEKPLSFNNISSSPGISFNPAYSISKLHKSGIVSKDENNNYCIVGKTILNSESANKCSERKYDTLTKIDIDMLSYIFLDFCDEYGFHRNTFLDSYAHAIAKITKNKLTENQIESVIELFNSTCKPFEVHIESYEPLSICMKKFCENNDSAIVSIKVLKHWLEHIHGMKYKIADKINRDNDCISVTFESCSKPHNDNHMKNEKTDCTFAVLISDTECRVVSHPVQVKIIGRLTEKLASRNMIIDEIDACYTTVNTNLKKMSDSGLISSVDVKGVSYCFPAHNILIFAGGGGIEYQDDILPYDDSNNILNGFFNFMCQKLGNEKQLTTVLGSFIFNKMYRKYDTCQKELLFDFAERLNLELTLERGLPLTYRIKHPVNGFNKTKDNLVIGAIRNQIASSIGHNVVLTYRTNNETESEVEISVIGA